MSKILPLPLAVLLAAGLCLAQTPASQPAAGATSKPAAEAAGTVSPAPSAATSQPAGAKVTVVSVTGQAQKCDASVEPRKWEALKAGDVLSELTIIRTGLDSGVVLNLAGRGEVRIGSATKIGITEFRKEGASAKTSLGLKYGSIQAQVDSKTGPADFRVATPTATLSVRGSQPQVYYGADTGTHGFSLEGMLYLVGAGSSQAVNPGEGTGDQNLPPILLLLAQFWSQGGDLFGLSGPELQYLLLNGQGRGGNNGGQNLGTPPTPPPSREPGYP